MVTSLMPAETHQLTALVRSLVSWSVSCTRMFPYLSLSSGETESRSPMMMPGSRPLATSFSAAPSQHMIISASQSRARGTGCVGKVPLARMTIFAAGVAEWAIEGVSAAAGVVETEAEAGLATAAVVETGTAEEAGAAAGTGPVVTAAAGTAVGPETAAGPLAVVAEGVVMIEAEAGTAAITGPAAAVVAIEAEAELAEAKTGTVVGSVAAAGAEAGAEVAELDIFGVMLF